MGCAQSKIENEETVSRCKDRKQSMKEAVLARKAFAAAHSSYAISLKNTGAALSDYAHGEVPLSSSSSSATPVAPPSYESLPPPPPPLPNLSTPSLPRSASMPELAIPKPDIKQSDTIFEEGNEDDEIEGDSSLSLRRRSSKRSGGSSSSRSGISHREVEEDEHFPPPPSPPMTPPRQGELASSPPPPPLYPPEAKGTPYDFFFPSTENVPGPNLIDVDDNRVEREEFDRKMFEEMSKRNEIVGGVGGKRSVKVEVDVAEKREGLQAQPSPAAVAKTGKRVKHVIPAEGKRGSSMNLLPIFSELDDYFLKASESAYEVSKMLEANSLHYHSNFADNGGHIDHSARVMRVITWNRSFRGLSNTDDRNDDFDSEQNETHATVLDKMLAWEKKLYDEVKVGEQMKHEYQRKVAALNKLKKHHNNAEALERMKATVSHLHTRYIVDMQSMDSTVSEINRLRDKQLYPKLVALVDGMATMWETMHRHHEKQSGIVLALKSLDSSQSAKETTERHHEHTIQLWSVVQEWHSQFEKLITHQKEYIRALNSWLKLNLIPIDNNLKEKVSSPQRPQSPLIQALLYTWHDHLEKLPDEIARSAIFNFSAVINTIVQYQEEEMKLRDKRDGTRRELARKNRQFEDWKNKFMQRRTPPDEMDPNRAHDNDLLAERKSVVEVISNRLQREEEEYQKQCIQVREKSLTSLKNRLPEIFRAISDFSHVCSDMYRNLRNISRPVNTNGGSL